VARIGERALVDEPALAENPERGKCRHGKKVELPAKQTTALVATADVRPRCLLGTMPKSIVHASEDSRVRLPMQESQPCPA
jgi:hypothetical protein